MKKLKPLIINRSGTSRRTIYKNENPDPLIVTYLVVHEEWNGVSGEFDEKFRKTLDYWYEACEFVNYKLTLVG